MSVCGMRYHGTITKYVLTVSVNDGEVLEVTPNCGDIQLLLSKRILYFIKLENIDREL